MKNMLSVSVTKEMQYRSFGDLSNDSLNTSELDNLFGEDNRIIRNAFLSDVDSEYEIFDNRINFNELFFDLN